REKSVFSPKCWSSILRIAALRRTETPGAKLRKKKVWSAGDACCARTKTKTMSCDDPESKSGFPVSRHSSADFEATASRVPTIREQTQNVVVEDTKRAMNNTHAIIAKGFAAAAGEGERIWFVADTLTLKATAASTGKSFTVVECLTTP